MNEPPDVEIGPLKVWVHGREFEDDHDYWDGNWMRATAICSENGASVRVHGAIIHLGELRDLIRGCEKLGEGEAELSTMERQLDLRIRPADRGLDVCVAITPDRLTQEHRFHFTLDQSHLPGFVASLRGILTTYPVRGL